MKGSGYTSHRGRSFTWAAALQGADLVGEYEFPQLRKTDYIPKQVTPFNELLRREERGGLCGHFFIDDYQFERIWNMPDRYLPILQECEGMIAPDFSMYSFMSKSWRIWNCYRNRVIAYWMQQNGIEVIPAVEWGAKEDLAWCLDGIPRGSVIAVGVYGCRKDLWARQSLLRGFESACRKLEPKAVIAYGGPIRELESLCRKVYWVPNYCDELKKRV